MGLFTKKKLRVLTVNACVSGSVIPMNKIDDPVFSDGILGYCAGIEPVDGQILAPVDGEVTQVAESGHAIGMETAEGAEILIHVGIDTVDMNGDGFSPLVKLGDKITRGQLILTADLEKIRTAGHATTVITAMTNSGEMGDVQITEKAGVLSGEALFSVTLQKS